MRIPQATIQQILSSVNIVDVVSQYVPLRVKGKNHWGVCPFHSEKTPSFSVSEDKQIFHCFGCHAGGNVYKFLMDYKKISYVEAVQELAQLLGIHISYEDQTDQKEISELEELYELNEEVIKLYNTELYESTAGKTAFDYLLNRGLKQATLRAFQIGYAPANRMFLSDFFGANSRKASLALKIGLLGKNDQGRVYDRFSGRIIFPIFSTNGRVVAFAGRIIEKSEYAGKYVNSPESSIYSKGKILYGLSHGKDDIRKTGNAIVVEGYLDLISLYQNGIKNVIAVSGTALTEGQAMLLSRYTKDVTLLFDADEAGVKASMRNVDVLLRQGMNIRVASLPSGEDPDSFIQKNTPADFLHLINQAQNFLEFQTIYYDKKGDLRDPLKSADIIRELLRPVALLDDPLKQSRLLSSLAERFKLSQQLLEDELYKIQRKNQDLYKPAVEPPKSRVQSETPASKAPSAQRMKFERFILKALLEGEFEIVGFIKKNIELSEIEDSQNKKIIEIFYSLHDQELDVTPGAVVDLLQDQNLLEYFTGLAIEPYTVSEEWEKQYPSLERNLRLQQMVLDIVKRFKISRIQEELKQLQHSLGTETSPEKQSVLLGEYKELRDTIKIIESKYKTIDNEEIEE